MKKHWTGKIVLCIAVILLACVAAQAQDPIPLPTVPPHTRPPFVYHLDPLFPVVDWVIPAGAGPAGAVVVGFADGVRQPTEPWHFETEWHNPGGAPIVMPIIFRGPNPAFPIAGLLALPGGARVIIEFIFHEAPEVGGWAYTMIPMVGNPAFHHDASVCEDPPAGCDTLMPPEWEEKPVAEIEIIPHTEVKFTRPIPAHTPWGLIILVGLVIISGLWLWRRRRVKLAA